MVVELMRPCALRWFLCACNVQIAVSQWPFSMERRFYGASQQYKNDSLTAMARRVHKGCPRTQGVPLLQTQKQNHQASSSHADSPVLSAQNSQRHIRNQIATYGPAHKPSFAPPHKLVSSFNPAGIKPTWACLKRSHHTQCHHHSDPQLPCQSPEACPKFNTPASAASCRHQSCI